MIDSCATNSEKINETLKLYENETNNLIYHSLVDRVKEHQKLASCIEKKAEKDMAVINLVTKDWLSVLKNNPIFQEYLNFNMQYFKYDSQSNKAFITYRVKEFAKQINVIVTGTFKLDKGKNLRLKVIDCLPLQFIGEILGLNIDKNILPNSKFFINGCHGLCLKCRDYNVLRDNEWCVQNCMVYHDEKLQFCNREYYESAYPNEAKLILFLQIDSVYSFGDKCKLGGNVKSIINIESIFNYTDDSIEGCLKLDENFVPNVNTSDDELKRKNEEEDSPESKHLKVNDTVLVIPKGVTYIDSNKKKFDVATSVKPMPDT